MRFEDVIGQEDVKQRLIHSFQEGRIAHALLFLGPEGCGNLALALAFAQYISCPNRTDLDSCGQCPSCRKHQQAQAPDVFFTFPFFNKSEGSDKKTICNDFLANFRENLLQDPYMTLDSWRDRLTHDNKQFHISVYEAGQIIQQLTLKSYEGGYKFQIIWMADYLKTDTANKLLKILEEPPEKTIFLLVASSRENMLATILSRVQTIYIPRISDGEVREALQANGVSESAAESISHYAHGNWKKALELANSADADESLFMNFQNWMRMCFKKDMGAILRWTDEMNKLSREDQKHFLVYALDQVRQNLALNYVGPDFVRMNDIERDFSIKFSRFINDLNAEDLLAVIGDAHYDITRNVNTKMVFTDLSVKVFYLLKREQ